MLSSRAQRRTWAHTYGAFGLFFILTGAHGRAIQGILDRYQQIQPKIIFSETEVVWAGKSFDVVPKVAEVARALDTHGLQRVVLLPSVASGRDLSAKGLAQVPKRSVMESLSLATTCL